MANIRTVNLFANQAKPFVRSAKKQAMNLNGIHFAPKKLSSDLLEISKKAKTSVEQAVKDYFAATNNDAKEKAYNIIDRYIQKIAKKEFISSGESSFEDHLQNVRLRFWRIINKRKEKGVDVSRNITATMVEGQPNAQIRAKIKTSPNMEKYAEDFSCTDLSTEVFEKDDFVNYLISTIRNSANAEFLKGIIDGEDVNRLADKYDLTRRRIIQRAKNAAEEFKEKAKLILSEDYLAEKSNFGLSVERNSIIKG